MTLLLLDIGKRRTKNEKKESTLSNERRSFGRCYLSYWKLLPNTSNSLLDMGGVMSEKHDIQIINADESHNEIIDSMRQVVDGLVIDCFEDEEEAEKRDCDLFLRFSKREVSDDERRSRLRYTRGASNCHLQGRKVGRL